MTKHNPAPRRDAVLAALRACGQASASRLAEVMKWPARGVRSVIANARAEMPGQSFRIVSYEWQQGGRKGCQLAIYEAAGGIDAPRLVADIERRRAQKRAYRERNRTVINARAKHAKDSRDTTPQKVLDYSEETNGLLRPSLPLSKEIRRELVKRHYPHVSNDALSVWLGVDKKTIHADNRAFGLRKTKELKSIIQSRTQQDTSPWQPPLVEILELMYPVMCAEDLSDLLGLSVNVIRKKAYYHGWKRLQNLDDNRPLCAPRPKAKAKAAPAKAVKKPIKAAAKKPEVRAANLPSPMSAAQLARREKERFYYPPEALPWRAEKMRGPVYVPESVSYRGQTQRSTACNP